jgi:hypothetical protein
MSFKGGIKMTEEGNMPGPEQRPRSEQPITEARPSPPLKPLSEEISPLLVPEVDEQGNVVNEPIIHQDNLSLRTRVTPFLHEDSDNLDDLSVGIRKINDWFSSQVDLKEQGKITEEEYRQRITEGLAAKQVLQGRRTLLSRIQQKEQERVRQREETINPYVQTLPTEMGAAFSQGRYREQIMRGSIRGDELRPVLDVANTEDRDRWLLLNARTFLERDTILNPQDVWEQYTNFWVEDFREAIMYLRKITSQSEELITKDQETEFIRKIKSFMAVASSAAAMRFSGGDFNKYAEGVAHLRGGELNLDAKDFWVESLLHGDPDKLVVVLSDPLVGTFYQEIVKRAGVVIPDFIHWVNVRGERVPSPQDGGVRQELTEWEPIIDRTVLFDQQGRKRTDNENLLQYLDKGGGGFDAFIREVLLPRAEDYNNLELVTAARMACNAFLVDKYTQWEYLVNRVRQETFEIKPTGRDWGGNPFISCLVPSFLVHDVKRMYQGVGEAVAEEIDDAFFPEEVFNTNMTPEGLNRLARLILEALPRLSEERLQNLSNQERVQIIGRSIERIIPQLDNIAAEDEIYFGKSAQENNQYRLNPDFDPWQVISRRILTQADELLPLSLDQRVSMLDKIGGEPLSGATISESDQREFQAILKFRSLTRGVLDEATEATKINPTRPTATEDLKKLFRYNDAIFSVLGSSRGEGLPYWNDDTIGKLGKAIERIDDIYKGDKHVVGLIIARIIKTKVLASVLEGFDPDWRDKLGQIFSAPSGDVSTFLDADKALFGEHGDVRSGLIAHLMGVRRNIVVRGNNFFSIDYLDQAQQLLRQAAGLGPLERGMATNIRILNLFKSL